MWRCGERGVGEKWWRDVEWREGRERVREARRFVVRNLLSGSDGD